MKENNVMIDYIRPNYRFVIINDSNELKSETIRAIYKELKKYEQPSNNTIDITVDTSLTKSKSPSCISSIDLISAIENKNYLDARKAYLEEIKDEAEKVETIKQIKHLQKISDLEASIDIYGLPFRKRNIIDAVYYSETYCITGVFDGNNRELIKSFFKYNEIKEKDRGNNVDLIIVGSKPSPYWKYKNFGTKIEAALQNNETIFVDERTLIKNFPECIDEEKLNDLKKAYNDIEASEGLEKELTTKKTLTFVITGKLKSMDRKTAKEKIKNMGWETSESVSKNTDYLVSDGEISGAKMQKALELGTKIILEDEFLYMLQYPEEAGLSALKTESDGENDDKNQLKLSF